MARDVHRKTGRPAEGCGQEEAMARKTTGTDKTRGTRTAGGRTTAAAARTRSTTAAGRTRSTTTAGRSRSTATGAAATARKKVEDAASSVKKHVGDVLGISRARVPKDVPRATKDRGGRPKGVELGGTRRTGLKRAGVVGGVRGRGR